ncbi:hypothetical protein SAMN05428967_4456 [Phyllobacterium sp. YR620]|nr:hypothetical protein SAMN05428967_4456 [Phyllobacterium sp. YR620]
MRSEAAELRKIRDRLDALHPARWSLAADRDITFVESRLDSGELVEVARFHRGASSDEIDFVVNAPAMVGFLLGLVDRAITAARGSSGAPAKREPKDFAAEAAMKCEEPAFRVFLEQCHGLERPLTKDRVAQKLRTVLCVSSRKELNDSEAAADRWRKLRADFETWRKASR